MAKVVSFHLDAALVERVLSKGTRRVTCQEVKDAGPILAAARPPHLVVLSGDARDAADVAEALMDDDVFLATPVVGWRIQGTLADTSRLVALGVQIAEDGEEALSAACAEALDARDGRTIRVDPPVALEPAARDVLELHGRRVIVADDDPAMTWFVSDLLRAQGCDVQEACDGAIALDLARRSMPDLVISDIRMPRLDGLRLCRALRADPLLADVPVLLLSWKEDWLREAEQEGVAAAAYLAKRSTPEEVLARVLEVLGPHTRLERRLRQPGSARGSLDDTCPYRLLRLACATRPDSRLTVRCAAKAYELRIRDGAPQAAVCMTADGTVTRGVGAIDSLLAERSGRYSLSLELGPVDSELRGSLHQQIAACVARFRRALTPAEMPAPAVVEPSPRAAAPQALAPAQRPVGAGQPETLTRRPSARGLRPLDLAQRTTEATAGMPALPLPAVRPVLEKTLPLRRCAGSEPSHPQRPGQSAYLRWIGLAAVAALGIVLGAGARALRHPGALVPTPARTAAAR